MPKCTYCNRSEPISELTPMYEKNKPGWIRYYCDRCLPGVKGSMKSHEWNYLSFGRKGEVRNDNE